MADPPEFAPGRGASHARPAGHAFDDWVHAGAPALLAFATVLTGNRHDAADAVQDALVAVFQRWSRLAPDGAQDAYARRVIVNHRISWWRRVGRRERPAAADLDPRPGAATADPSDRTTDAVLARALLRTLPPRQRAAVALRFFDDLSFAEIAAILQCTESTARSYVHRAVGQLRADLAREEVPDA